MRDCKPCPFLLINVYHIFSSTSPKKKEYEKKVAECAHTLDIVVRMDIDIIRKQQQYQKGEKKNKEMRIP